MSFPVVGAIGIVVLVVLFLLRMPVAFAMLVVGAVGFWVLVSPVAGLALFGSDFFSQASMYTITVIPMFVLAGSLAFVGGMGDRIFSAAFALAGRFPGSLCIAATVANAVFGAVCGSSAAAAAAMGRVALPAMRKYNYDAALATGSIAAAGTLAVMIPPSTVFMIYGILTGQSIGKLFIAGVFPGILLMILFVLTVLLLCLRNPSLAPGGPKIGRREKMAGVVGVSEALILFLLVIGGLFKGWFSPTQAGAILVAGVAIISVARRKIDRKGFSFALKDTSKLSCMIIFIMVSALIFSRFMAVSRLPLILADILGSVGNRWVVFAIIMIFYAVGGCFMDGLALVMISIPIIFPTVLALNFDPIWFGVMLCAVGELGMITPPVGITVYVVKGIAPDVPMSTIFRGILPFVTAIVIFLIILAIFPQISLFLPSLTTY